LTTLVSAYTTAKNAAIAAVAAAENATASKDNALENLTDAMKSDIHYKERSETQKHEITPNPTAIQRRLSATLNAGQ
jgi:FKBP-type peptidyl-prolyl cis-trans isomerase